MARISKSQFISGALWKMVEQFSAKGLSLLFSIFLARLLSPGDYGLMALTVVFTNLSDILIDGGFSTTLIRKKEVSDSDYSSVWLISMATAATLYTLLFFLAPAISRYYAQPQLTAVLRVIALVLFLQAFSSVRIAYVTRNLRFKLLFQCNLAGTALSGVLGIGAAVSGWGVWALVLQRLSQQLLVTALLLWRLRWKMPWKFRLQTVRQMLRFSTGVVASSLVSYFGSSIYSLIIGKRYSVTELGYYDKGGQLPTQISLYTFGAMSHVLLPTLAAYQSEPEKMKQVIRRVVQMTAYLIAPMMVGLALVAEETVILLFTEKWLPVVPILRWNCLYYFATPFMLINVQVFFALGRSGKRVKTELIRLALLTLGALVFGVILGRSVTELALLCAVVAVISEFLTALDVRTMVAYRLRERFRDLWIPCLSALVMGAGVLAADVGFLETAVSSPVLSLLAKILLGVAIYGGLSLLWKPQGFREITALLKRRRT